MDDRQLRAELVALDYTPNQFASLLRSLGDPGEQASIERRVRRWANGEAAVPGEVVALLSLLRMVTKAAQTLQLVVADDQKSAGSLMKRPKGAARPRKAGLKTF